MIKRSTPPLDLWFFDNLSKQSGIKHFVTDRRARPEGKEFTLSYSSVPDRNEVVENRALLSQALGISPNQLYLPSQVHKTRIVRVTSSLDRSELADTDALVTNERGVCIAVMSADCVPVVLYDKRNNVVAAIHSGWKGTVARIVEKTLNYMHVNFGSSGQDIIAGIGPSVSQKAYEVGEEVVEAVKTSFQNASQLLIPQENKKAKFDLWKANETQLMEFGVPKDQIEITDLCTVTDNQYFFSARKGDSGRFAAGIMMT